MPSSINDRDGGIDARVSARLDKEGLIKNGLTHYQIKAGPISLSKGASSKIRQIMFGNDGALKPQIRLCFDSGGTLVVALFGSDRAEQKPDEIACAFKKILAENCEKVYENPKIEILKQNQIAGFLEFHLPLRLEILDNPGSFHTHEEWKKMGDMIPKYRKGDRLERQLEEFRNELRKPNKINIRVVGEPGIGKTRFIMEATKADDLIAQVVYLENPEHLTHEPRSRHLATLFKPKIEELDSLLYRFLAKYGGDEEVRSALHRSFFSESWEGSASDHYTNHKKTVLKIKEKMSEPHALIWLNEYVQSLDQRITVQGGGRARVNGHVGHPASLGHASLDFSCEGSAPSVVRTRRVWPKPVPHAAGQITRHNSQRPILKSNRRQRPPA